MRIVIHSNAAWGGIVDYMIQQADAMTSLGCTVVLIVPENFEKSVHEEVTVLRVLPNLEKRNSTSKTIRRLTWIAETLKGWKITTTETLKIKPEVLLFSAFVEYLSPLWKHRISRLRKRLPRLKIGAVIHDPVRLAIGPEFFHRYSVKCAFEMLDTAFLHSQIDLDQAGASPPASVQIIPFGPLDFPDSRGSQSTLRKRLGIDENATLIISFGHIRNNKNLDIAIRMLSNFPEVILLIAGKLLSSRDKPVSFYEALAKKNGVQDQLVILERFIPDNEIGALFEAADYALLSYDGDFVSASGVLHVALKFRKLVLATSGDGHLKWAVNQYQLGIWTEPDSEEALSSGLNRLMHEKITPRWEAYEAENTWEENAQRIVSTFSPSFD